VPYNVLFIGLQRIKITSVLIPLKQLEVKNLNPEFKTPKFLGAFVFGGGIFLGGVIITVGYILSNIAHEKLALTNMAFAFTFGAGAAKTLTTKWAEKVK